MSFTASNIDFGVKPLFSFALRTGETSAFSLPVGATDIFKRSLRGLKTAKTRAWVRKPSEKRSRKFRSSLFKGLWELKGQSPSFAPYTDKHTFSQLTKRLHVVRSAGGEFGEQSGGLFPKEGETCKRGRTLESTSEKHTF